MATYTDIIADQGSTYSSQIEVRNALNLPYDLTGCDARGQIRKSYMSTTAVDFTAVVDGDPYTGVVHINLSAEQTLAMKAGRYLYDVEIYRDYIENGQSVTLVMRIAEGQFEINPSVTRA